MRGPIWVTTKRLQRFAFYLKQGIPLTGKAVVARQPRSPVRGIQIKRKAL